MSNTREILAALLTLALDAAPPTTRSTSATELLDRQIENLRLQLVEMQERAKKHGLNQYEAVRFQRVELQWRNLQQQRNSLR